MTGWRPRLGVIGNMLSQKIKDLKHRLLYSRQEKKRALQKFLLISFLRNNKISLQSYLLLKKGHNTKLIHKVKGRVVRRCSFSNKGRATFRPYNVSRHILREHMRQGVLPGSKKAV